MDGSEEFSRLHARAVYGQEVLKLKMNRKRFTENSNYAHLIVRAFACEKVLKQHAIKPYETVDEVLGDIQIELVNCLNKFRGNTAYHSMPVYEVEDFILMERV